MNPMRWPILLCVAGALSGGVGSADVQVVERAVPVVVELFTSQGCSSCPPADALLSDLDRQPIAGAELIVLSQHVDYWNGLGWEDPFSAREFSLRQRRYGERLADGRVYTPQMVVNGSVEFVGNRREQAYDVIAAATRDAADPVAVRVEVLWAKATAASLRIVLSGLSRVGSPFDVMLAVTESGLESDVRRGENAGRRLSHAGVVRSLQSLGVVRPEAGDYEKTRRVPLEASWDRSGLRAVVFLQQRDQGRILGAATAPLAVRVDE